MIYTRTFFMASMVISSALIQADTNFDLTMVSGTKQAETNVPKIITLSEMKMLNTILAARPEGALRMNMASDIIKKVQKEIVIKKETFNGDKIREKIFVHEQLMRILKPVQPFFEIIQDPMVLKLVKPLIHVSVDDIAISHLVKFCDSHKDIVSFSEQEVQDCATLTTLCQELLQFFESINLSLSDDARKALDKLRHNLKEQAKKKKADQITQHHG